MKLCITAAGNTLSAPTDSAFGRAPWFMLVDTDSGAAEALANSSADAVQGAGIAMHEGLGRCTVGEALAQFRAGTAASAASAGQGPGRGMGGRGRR